MNGMKPLKMLLGMFAFSGMLFITSCNDDDDAAPALTIQSITATGTDLETGSSVERDLNAATSADNVPVSPVIRVTFSGDVDPATATAANATLTSGGGTVPVTVAASGNTMTITPQEELNRGTDYTLTLSGNIRGTQGGSFASTTRTFRTGGRAAVTPPQAAAQVLYLSFDGNADSQVGDANTVFEQIAYETDRFGFTDGAANFRGATAAGNGDLVEIDAGEPLIYPSMTITTWFKLDAADYNDSRFMFGLGGERGYFMELGSGGVAWMKLATSHSLDPDPAGHGYGVSWTDPNGSGRSEGQYIQEYEGSISALVANGEWHQLAMTFDANESIKTIYINGAVILQADIDSDTQEWFLKDMALNSEGVEDDMLDTNLALGFAAGRTNRTNDWSTYSESLRTFKGLLDDFRIFNTALTAAEIQTLYNAERP
jgi:hypothetical protein